MKPTPTERRALDLAATLAPLDLETASALATAPDLTTFPRRLDRLRLAETRLVWAAEEWRRRELRLALYQHALRNADRGEITHQRVTNLDNPTASIRANLLRHYRAHAEAQANTTRLL